MRTRAPLKNQHPTTGASRILDAAAPLCSLLLKSKMTHYSAGENDQHEMEGSTWDPTSAAQLATRCKVHSVDNLKPCSPILPILWKFHAAKSYSRAREWLATLCTLGVLHTFVQCGCLCFSLLHAVHGGRINDNNRGGEPVWSLTTAGTTVTRIDSLSLRWNSQGHSSGSHLHVCVCPKQLQWACRAATRICAAAEASPCFLPSLPGKMKKAN